MYFGQVMKSDKPETQCKHAITQFQYKFINWANIAKIYIRCGYKILV